MFTMCERRSERDFLLRRTLKMFGLICLRWLVISIKYAVALVLFTSRKKRYLWCKFLNKVSSGLACWRCTRSPLSLLAPRVNFLMRSCGRQQKTSIPSHYSHYGVIYPRILVCFLWARHQNTFILMPQTLWGNHNWESQQPFLAYCPCTPYPLN